MIRECCRQSIYISWIPYPPYLEIYIHVNWSLSTSISIKGGYSHPHIIYSHNIVYPPQTSLLGGQLTRTLDIALAQNHYGIIYTFIEQKNKDHIKELQPLQERQSFLPCLCFPHRSSCTATAAQLWTPRAVSSSSRFCRGLSPAPRLHRIQKVSPELLSNSVISSLLVIKLCLFLSFVIDIHYKKQC